MKRILTHLLVLVAWAGGRALTVTDTIFDRAAHEKDFAFGADIGFVSQMESWGTKWLDKNGRQKDILQILKEQGINNIRLRVWTTTGFCGKNDVVNMCKRAKAKGMGVMIDFHYSDTWADPGSQTIPSAWTNQSVDALAKNVYDHTYDVLSAIKAAGVTPKWVQVGNETKRGMLYPVGQTNKGGSVAFAKFVQSGYNAVKAVDPSMQVIVHLPDGHDNSLYRSIFDGLKKNGAKWDIIGMSAYPRWSHLDGPTMITKVMANINDLKSRYKTPVMVVETGHYWNKAIEGNQYLVGLMDRMIKNGDLGVFYWEPESMGGYELGAWNPDTKMPTEMMDAFLGIKHTEVSWILRTSILSPTKNETVEGGESVLLKARVNHVQKKNVKTYFYVDNRIAGTVSASPYEYEVTDLEIGPHTFWAKAVDDAKNEERTDTITFFVGQSSLMEECVSTNTDQKEGTKEWTVNFREAGPYMLCFLYNNNALRSSILTLDADTLERKYFYARNNASSTTNVDIVQTGPQRVCLSAVTTKGLPSDITLRVFPLAGQMVPGEGLTDGVQLYEASAGDAVVDIYSLSGRFVRRTTERQLGLSLGSRESAVVLLPNCVGGTPNIVRKVRLK